MPDDLRPDLTGLHVLLVDDNEDARVILGLFLEDCGATVTTARNAGDALAAVNEVRAHIIISDLSMPGMDGVELLTRIRSLPAERESRTPAIAFSGYNTRENRDAAQRPASTCSSRNRPTRSMSRTTSGASRGVIGGSNPCRANSIRHRSRGGGCRSS